MAKYVQWIYNPLPILRNRTSWVRFCENNPTNEAAEFVLDRTDLAATGNDGHPSCGVLVDGAALVRMENGSAMYRDTPSNPQYGAYRPTFGQRGRMVFSGRLTIKSLALT